MIQVRVEDNGKEATFEVRYMEDALEMATKLGGLMFQCLITIYENVGDEVITHDIQRWHFGKVTYIPVKPSIDDMSTCFCGDDAELDFGMCMDCANMLDALI